MPQPFNSAIMTNGGAQLLTKAQAGKVKIEFTKIEIGDGIYTAEEKTLDYLQEQTGLKSFRNNYPISDVEIYNEYSVKVTALITNQDPVTGGTLIDSGFYINEMGLYAKEKDGTDDTEVLYSIAVTSGENGDFMPPFNGYNPAQITQDYFATVNNSAEVTIQSSGAVALAEDLVEVRKEIEQLKRNGSAGAYSTEIEYHEGEYCLYNNILYKCTKDTQGEWDPKCWVQTNPMEEIMSLRTSLNSLASLFGTDEKGNMRQLGEAAFAGISHNFLTEPENNMVAGADLLKLLKDQVDEQNSASLPIIVQTDLKKAKITTLTNASKNDPKFCLLITCNGLSGTAYAAYLVQGYGMGEARFHVTPLHTGGNFTFQILENESAIIIDSKSGQWDCSVFAVYGLLPNIAKV